MAERLAKFVDACHILPALQYPGQSERCLPPHLLTWSKVHATMLRKNTLKNKKKRRGLVQYPIFAIKQEYTVFYTSKICTHTHMHTTTHTPQHTLTPHTQTPHTHTPHTHTHTDTTTHTQTPHTTHTYTHRHHNTYTHRHHNTYTHTHTHTHTHTGCA